MTENDKGKKEPKKSEPEWKPDKTQILTIEESLAKKGKEKQEKEK